jgi:hypothetical protein
LNSKDEVSHLASKYGICTETIPNYIQTNEIFSQELMFIIATRFADCNMDYYPPGHGTDLWEGCNIFQSNVHTFEENVGAFLRMEKGMMMCFDMMSQLPHGPHATISASDWSGVGGDASSLPFDFQTCTPLIPEISMSEQSMFVHREWTILWLTDHCQSRFGVTPDPDALLHEFGRFDDVTDFSRLLFVNGVNDGWYVASIVEEPSENDSIRVINLPNGTFREIVEVCVVDVTISNHLTML